MEYVVWSNGVPLVYDNKINFNFLYDDDGEPIPWNEMKWTSKFYSIPEVKFEDIEERKV